MEFWNSDVFFYFCAKIFIFNCQDMSRWMFCSAQPQTFSFVICFIRLLFKICFSFYNIHTKTHFIIITIIIMLFCFVCLKQSDECYQWDFEYVLWMYLCTCICFFVVFRLCFFALVVLFLWLIHTEWRKKMVLP